MNNVFVYCEIEEGHVVDVSLELPDKGRTLANELNCKLEAIVIGARAKRDRKTDYALRSGYGIYCRRQTFVSLSNIATHFGYC